jgi:hypothetical protein
MVIPDPFQFLPLRLTQHNFQWWGHSAPLVC